MLGSEPPPYPSISNRAYPVWFFHKILPVVGLIVSIFPIFADEVAEKRSDNAQPSASQSLAYQPGHSEHGEIFNEGPRQAAYLLPGMGNVVFQASTSHPLAQRFIHQGVAQLHGFWYYEAERSFRQAAMHDPECAICYWGMSMANTGNRPRARGFIAEAVKRKANASRREVMFIEAWQRNLKEEDGGKKISKKDRAQRYTRDIEDLVTEYPDDLEAKAFLALQLWENEKNDLPITSRVAIDAVLEDVFDANPMHPAHHYRIHLWDSTKPQRALRSAALAGPSLPGIAHMWHMPGHTYSKLHRYHDAAWQQEASARVDHAHMMRDRVLPDQIHNFAHNNEWLIRNLLKLGRVDDAISLSKNMLELPRHPKLNTLDKGSSNYGRQRLLLTLSSYRLWPQLIALADTMYLEPTDSELLQIERLRYLAVAHAWLKQAEQAKSVSDELRSRLAKTTEEMDRLDAQAKADKSASESSKPDSEKPTLTPAQSKQEVAVVDKNCDSARPLTAADRKKAEFNRQRRKQVRDDKMKALKPAKESLEKTIAEIDAVNAAHRGDWTKALELLDKSASEDKLVKAEWLASAGKFEESLKLLDKEIKDKPSEVLPLSVHALVCSLNDKLDAAKESFDKLRTLASAANLDTPMLARLSPLAEKLGHTSHWAVAYERAKDVGQRPLLDTLGSFRWSPYIAPDWDLESGRGSRLSSKNLKGKPHVLIFYLGFGCLHCVEQLHEFAPRVDEFRRQGIEVVGISSENMESLKAGIAGYDKPLDIPLHPDPQLDVFKAYRCYDDFEQQPLHGTFVIASDGRVLWQDISYEPFKDVDFLLKESMRLLSIPPR